MISTPDYSRYQYSIENGVPLTVPGVTLDVKSTDIYIVWKSNLSRTDKLSNHYYGNPYWGFLILTANPQYGPMEFDIPDNSVIRIPYPYQITVQEYLSKVQNIANTN